MSLSPGDTIGMLGGGQLGRMMALAAARLGLKTHIYAPPGDAPAADVAAAHTSAAYDDAAALAAFVTNVDVVTYEFENVPVAPLRPHAAHVRPAITALEAAQDRVTEKAFLAESGLPVVRHAAVDSAADLAAAARHVGLPAILKTRRFGYDGKGQVRVEPGHDLGAAFAAIGEAPAILEAAIPLAAETSTILVRSADGACLAYDHPLNAHSEGILRRSTLPGPLSPTQAGEAQALVAALADALSYVGVLTVEWFIDTEGRLIANEMAPRVHNTGHWTEDGARTSQFENHVRAIAGWPLGPVERAGPIEMRNLIGSDVDGWRDYLHNDRARLHLYGKAAARPGRKMGHVNIVPPPVDNRGEGC
ncbi:MAG: 5-(carboxyamino)imidazole ribonucleotide synthase [Pseudomonadota bacterium]